MARVEGWFERYGAATVFFTRMLPIVRTFISTPAGAAHMNIVKFTIYTAAGCIPWVLMLGYIGVKVGENWEEWRDKLHYFDYVVLAGLIALAVWAFIKWRRGGWGGDDDPQDPKVAETTAPATTEG
jgi:membrane protein DedA with SNARE-associated domain